MHRYVDMHCHILPGVDDGAKDMEETCRMLSIAFGEGIRIITATPHYMIGRKNIESDRLRKLKEEVCANIEQSGNKLQIILGNELFYSSGIIDALKNGEALSIDDTRYILVEFLPNASYREIRSGINHCVLSGYIPILAHTERYHSLIKQPSYVEELILIGAYIQLNLSSISRWIVNSNASFSHKLLKKGWVHFLGTDAHDAIKRTPCMKPAINILKKRYGTELVDRLLWENPMTMLENKYLSW